MEELEKLISKYGGENIESYFLVNNYGITFDYKGIKYDARYWANCYGVALKKWIISPSTENANICALEKELNVMGGI